MGKQLAPQPCPGPEGEAHSRTCLGMHRIPSWRRKVVLAISILQLRNQLGSSGQDDEVNWECHMLASPEPGLPERKPVTESAVL